MEGALLETTDLRIDVGGVPAVDGLALKTSSERALVLGAARALFEAATGTRRPARGSVLVRGEAAATAALRARVAGAPLDPALPAKWTARRYTRWSARLAGRDPHDAKTLADDAILRLKMGKIADLPLGAAPPHGRRATVVAAAVATGAPIVMLEDPLSGLADTVASGFAHILVEALAGRAWVVFAPRLPLGSPLALAAEEALLVDGSVVAAQGAPAEVAGRTRTYALRVHGDLDALAQSAEARGARVTRGPARLTVDLGESLSTRDLLAMALEARAVVVEMSPLSRALD
jgi:ABC-type multidrug transport system ATPase subunit